MKGDKFLTAILAGIGVLILVALALFFIRQSQETYLPEDTPEGVAHNYILAVFQKDYARAYGYLAEGENKPSYEEFEAHFFDNRAIEENSVEFGNTRFLDGKALVQLNLSDESYSGSSRLYYGEERSSAILVQQNGAWRIKEMPYPFWGWTWYQEDY